MQETIVKTNAATNGTRNKEQPYYELYILLHPSALDGEVSEIEKKITELIEHHGGKFKQLKKFVRSELAYPIKNMPYAYAGSFYFWAEIKALSAIEAGLKISELAILRSIILRIDPSNQKQNLKTLDALLEQKLAYEVKEPKETWERTPKKESSLIPRRDSEDRKIAPEKKEDNKITLEDIDKKLDEIMGNL